MSSPSRSRLMPTSTSNAPKPQVAQDLDALQRVDVGMHVAHTHVVLVQIFGEILRHALGQHRHERAVARLRRLAHLAQQIVHLRARGTDIDGGIDEPGGADDLLGKGRRRSAPSPICRAWPRHAPIAGRMASHSSKRRGRLSRARRQAKAEFGERRLAAEVAAIHPADLRHGDVALIGEDEGIVGQVFEQGRRRLAGAAAG